MKKSLLVIMCGMLLVACTKHDDILPELPKASEALTIKSAVGIKLESAFVTSEVAMNVKLETAGTVTIKIFDISNRVVSKEAMSVKAGDNILKVYTSALPSSAYRIGLYDSNGKELGITDFNKL
jgi:hypothetical protein